jgi:hypothetical protein
MAESRAEKQQRKDLEALRSAFQDTQSPSPAKVTNRKFTPQAHRPDPSRTHETSPRQGTLTSILATVGQHGFTHPDRGGYLMLPPEFDVLLALERKPVVQVVLEIMRATMGWVDESGEEDEHGRPKRREWARLGHRHFTTLCGSPSQASFGLKTALEKGYILRRVTPSGYEYQIHWSRSLPQKSDLQD